MEKFHIVMSGQFRTLAMFKCLLWSVAISEMKRLVDLNHGALFEDTSGLVGSAPFKLGDQVWFASTILTSLKFICHSRPQV